MKVRKLSWCVLLACCLAGCNDQNSEQQNQESNNSVPQGPEGPPDGRTDIGPNGEGRPGEGGNHTNDINDKVELSDTDGFTDTIYGYGAGAYSAADDFTAQKFAKNIAINVQERCVTVNDEDECHDYSASQYDAYSDGEDRISLSQADSVLNISSNVKGVYYHLTGSATGSVVIDTKKDFAVELAGVELVSATGPALSFGKGKAFVVLADNSENKLTDDVDNGDKAALYSKGSVVVAAGKDQNSWGKLTINGLYKHGISVKDSLRITGGNLEVNVSARDAIRAVNSFIMDAGKLTIKGTGSGIDEESKGIKVEGDDSASGDGKGYIIINGGRIDSETISKGITASWDVDEDASTDYPDGNPNPYVEINNGIINVTTTGTPYEYTDSDGVEVSLSPEGIEGKANVVINGGLINLNTTDDGVNVSQTDGSLTINAGYLFVHSSSNDAIDSNGALYINGGIVVAVGTTTPECAFDADFNTFAINGGTIVGIGTSNYTAVTANESAQNSLTMASSAASAGQTMAIVDGDKKAIFAYDIPNENYEVMILSTAGLIDNGSYTIMNKVSASSDEYFHGLYLGNITISGGSDGESVTISGRSTTVGTINNNGPQDGPPGGPNGGPNGPGGQTPPSPPSK